MQQKMKDMSPGTPEVSETWVRICDSNPLTFSMSASFADHARVSLTSPMVHKQNAGLGTSWFCVRARNPLLKDVCVDTSTFNKSFVSSSLFCWCQRLPLFGCFSRAKKAAPPAQVGF